MQGNIEAPSLMIEEGATFNGQVSMPQSDSLKKGSSSLNSSKGAAPSAQKGDPQSQV
jgi:cytoskeletal protein CcmA (bactofilin family)